MKLSTKEKKRLMTKYGNWALVTGATSGIGLELSKQLASCGMNLIISARREALLTKISKSLKDNYSIDVHHMQADLSDENQIEKLISYTCNFQIGLLVANAGFGTSGFFTSADIDKELDMLKVNCSAVLKLTHHFSRKFKEKKAGGIILMSSMVGFQGVPFAAHYAATKAYVQSLGEALTVELKPFGVDVLSAAPGPVKTEFAEIANMQMGMALEPSAIGTPILKALGRKSTVLPGFLTKFLVNSLRTVPRWAKVRIMKIVMGGMTKHQLIT